MSHFYATFIAMFHEPINSYLQTSIIKQAIDNKVIVPNIISILESVNHNHHQIDDTPYGGGAGQLIKIDIIEPLIKKALSLTNLHREQKRVVLLDPAGKPFNQKEAQRLSTYDEIIFICPRYEGIDARIHYFIDEAISLGDFILSNGDIAALSMFDAIARLKPQVLGNQVSLQEESYNNYRLESSQYTRPKVFMGHEVPKVLQSGDHQSIAQYKLLESLMKTMTLRPDLLQNCSINQAEENFLSTLFKQNKTYPWKK